MSIQPTNLQWDQGEDLEINVRYSVDGSPVDLTGFSARMDIAKPNATGPIASLYTFNSPDADEETFDEITMDALGNIKIVVPRSLTLAGGPVAVDLANASTAKYVYDLFIRSGDDKQRKLMEGEITVKRSVTLWM